MSRAVLLVLAAVLMAGCAGAPDEAPPAEPSMPSGAAEAQAASPAEPVAVRLSHDFASAPGEERFLLVSEGPYAVSIRFESPDGSPGCASGNAAIEIFAPDGSTFALVQGTTLEAPCGSSGQHSNAATLPVGEWRVEWRGRGAVLGVVEMIPA